ncbi:hypothetical protein MIR68_002478 [Amoeboaphelidium protococcarum]|nr:hypothetical protein MIR68_002478 [Amoeboaphelidium protococcarum]KAI3654946.1 hypothetical protein MP228_000326 [Amoeboaphelidium protococcarum]
MVRKIYESDHVTLFTPDGLHDPQSSDHQCDNSGNNLEVLLAEYFTAFEQDCNVLESSYTSQYHESLWNSLHLPDQLPSFNWQKYVIKVQILLLGAIYKKYYPRLSSPVSGNKAAPAAKNGDRARVVSNTSTVRRLRSNAFNQSLDAPNVGGGDVFYSRQSSEDLCDDPLLLSVPPSSRSSSMSSSGISTCRQSPSRTVCLLDPISELVHTERVYVEDISMLIKYVYEPLTVENSVLALCIFANLKDIYNLHVEILQELDQQDEQQLSASCIGSIFLKNSSRFRIYAQYCSNYSNAVLLLQDQPCVALRKLLAAAPLGGLNLESHLLKPIQRICKYPLLLNQIMKQSCCTQGESEHLRLIVAQFHEHLLQINDETSQAKSLHKVCEVASSFKQSYSMVQIDRELIKEGRLILSEPAIGVVMVFLFNDQIVIASGEVGSLNLLYAIPIGSVNAVSQISSGLILETVELGYFTFQAKSQQSSQRWIDAIMSSTTSSCNTQQFNAQSRHLPQVNINVKTYRHSGNYEQLMTPQMNTLYISHQWTGETR